MKVQKETRRASEQQSSDEEIVVKIFIKYRYIILCIFESQCQLSNLGSKMNVVGIQISVNTTHNISSYVLITLLLFLFHIVLYGCLFHTTQLVQVTIQLAIYLTNQLVTLKFTVQLVNRCVTLFCCKKAMHFQRDFLLWLIVSCWQLTSNEFQRNFK